MIVKACVAQVGAVPFDVPASVSKAEEWIAKAGADGCQIVVHYARPDVFSLSVNEAPQPAVTLKNSTAW